MKVFNGIAKYVGDEAFKWTSHNSLTEGQEYVFSKGVFTDDELEESACAFNLRDLRGNGFVYVEGGDVDLTDEEQEQELEDCLPF